MYVVINWLRFETSLEVPVIIEKVAKMLTMLVVEFTRALQERVE